MKKYVIDLDLSKCVACGACAVACMDQNDYEVRDGQRPYRNIFDMELEKNNRVSYHRLSECLSQERPGDKSYGL